MSKLAPCNTCVFWVPVKDGKWGECHFSSPHETVQHTEGHRAIWPQTLGTYPGCSRHPRFSLEASTLNTKKTSVRKKKS